MEILLIISTFYIIQLDNNLTEVKETKICTLSELKMKQLGSVYYRDCIN